MAIDTRQGLFVPLTEVFEIENLDQIDINSPEFRDFLVRLRQIFNNHAMALNLKKTGIYTKTEFVDGEVWFPDPNLSSQTSRKPTERQKVSIVIECGALPNATTKTIPHGITFPTPDTYTAIKITGAASDYTNKVKIPLPYASPTLANNIEINIDDTNVNITTGIDRTSFTESHVVFEFIKE